MDSLEQNDAVAPVSSDQSEEVDAVEVSFDDALVSRLTVIEDQPLETRAAAYAQLHDELQGRLEGGDLPRTAG